MPKILRRAAPMVYVFRAYEWHTYRTINPWRTNIGNGLAQCNRCLLIDNTFAPHTCAAPKLTAELEDQLRAFAAEK